MVGGGHDGDLPQQHLGGLAVQPRLVDDLDGHPLCMETASNERDCVINSTVSTVAVKL